MTPPTLVQHANFQLTVTNAPQHLITSWVAIHAFALENPPFTSLLRGPSAIVATLTVTRKKRKMMNRMDGSLSWNLVVMLKKNLML